MRSVSEISKLGKHSYQGGPSDLLHSYKHALSLWLSVPVTVHFLVLFKVFPLSIHILPLKCKLLKSRGCGLFSVVSLPPRRGVPIVVTQDLSLWIPGEQSRRTANPLCPLGIVNHRGPGEPWGRLRSWPSDVSQPTLGCDHLWGGIFLLADLRRKALSQTKLTPRDSCLSSSCNGTSAQGFQIVILGIVSHILSMSK